MKFSLLSVVFLASFAGALPAEPATSEPGAVDNAVPLVESAVEAAEQSGKHKLTSRSIIQQSCSDTQFEFLERTLLDTEELANVGAGHAHGNYARVRDYFKDTSPITITTVELAFAKISREAGPFQQGAVQIHCKRREECAPGVVATTYARANIIAICPAFFQLPQRSRQCHGASQANVMLGELSQIPSLRGAQDFGTFGIQGVFRLDAGHNIWHSGTYQYFAQSAYASRWDRNC